MVNRRGVILAEVYLCLIKPFINIQKCATGKNSCADNVEKDICPIKHLQNINVVVFKLRQDLCSVKGLLMFLNAKRITTVSFDNLRCTNNVSLDYHLFCSCIDSEYLDLFLPQ